MRLSSPSSCPFCEVDHTDNGDLKNRIVFQDEEIIVFHDMKPASSMHLLVIPRNHIPANVKSLTIKDKPLLQHMIKTGRNILKQAKYSRKNIRLGFHIPPFLTINHLHLHCLGLPFRNKLVGIKYVNGSLWYKSADKIMRRLNGSKRSRKSKRLSKNEESGSDVESRREVSENGTGVESRRVSENGTGVESRREVSENCTGVDDDGGEEQQQTQGQLEESNSHRDIS
ncbi:2807_t:CDS:2 [Ambispora gerdemannii]|uniref:2807_t:CDS:1 n=1 Tax=Ambispora gerdemannii TaxID=144530 RepID=A0A9N9G1T6_9GLOM|nr:2807_t:CDS:2 [Ambispora gerdemannii]